MGMPVDTPRTWRFGVFELDASSGELRRNGTVVKLREQPARILLLLLEHAGQMVTREQLRQHLWPSDTFVDFDHSLNSAVMKLREALGDSADKPLYIETIPKKGYRFVAPVSQPGDTQNGGASSQATAGSEMVGLNTRKQSNGSVEVRTITPDEKQDRRRLLSRKLALIIVCVVSAIGIAALIRSSSLRSALVQFGSQPKPSSGEPNVMSPNLRSSILTSAPGDARSPSFSPDGRQIAFVWNGVERRHYDIYVQLVGGDTPLQLTHHKRGDGVPGPPQWSPDGREIAFARCNSDRDGVYTVPALGGPERRLTNSPCREWVAGRPIWTPDSKAMVMLDQCTPAGPRAVVLFSFATGEKRCLATGSHGDFGAEDALSPDGRTVAFSHHTDATYGELYAVPLSGEGPRRLVSGGIHFWNLMWTPDGKYIVFYSNRGNMMRAWRVPVAGGPVEPEMVYPGVGSISQDGRRLAYTESQTGEAPAIWRADLSKAGGPVLRTRKLIYSQFMEDCAQPSPDGTRLALQSGRSGTNQIWLNSTDGDHPVQLTNIGGHSGTPRWSPDGRWIAFDARVGDYAHIYVVDAEGRNLHAITHGDSDNVVPSWSRDGRFIYFASPRTGSRQIWKHSVEDGAERQLTEHGGFAPFESYDGRTIYYSKFDEAGIWSMSASGGSESPVVTGKPQVSYFGHWAVTESGLYLLDADAEPRPTIEFYSFATGRITPVLSLEKSPSDWQPSLSASRDGRTLFYTQYDPQSVIKMVENFRQE
ncbi:winged helix-turn-helix domain-containing protein [Edaphobacter modestus]|uniref:WD40 repeat protein n=1 Tax=Edaphobacter modestus TaxID=388466 RepID=A0A4V2G547_9BACT|nr:winged helix-turn-helix domain-containing protein [Edaphobacter modestus]RZU43456.1 WD40 repeat protein [Edaphobacter modestus]